MAGRVLAQQLGPALGQSIIVDNRPGAGGIVGVDTVAHAAPDGYDLLLIDPSLVTNPVLHKKMPFDAFKDLAPISLVGSSLDVLVVAPLTPDQDFCGSSHLRQSKSGQAQLRLARHRHHRPPRRRDVQAAAAH